MITVIVLALFGGTLASLSGSAMPVVYLMALGVGGGGVSLLAGNQKFRWLLLYCSILFCGSILGQGWADLKLGLEGIGIVVVLFVLLPPALVAGVSAAARVVRRGSQTVPEQLDSSEGFEPEGYSCVGWYNVAEAKRLLRELEKHGIDFVFQSSGSVPSGDDVIRASCGGEFGGSNQIALFINDKDSKRFREVHSPIFLRDELAG